MPRLDTDIVVLPVEVVNELAGLPNAAASNILALAYDLVGGMCGLSMLRDVELHHRMVHRRITANLALLAPELEAEVSECLTELFPQQTEDWVEVTPYPILLKLAARIFSRIIVGPELCRDKRWLDFATQFTENGQ